MSNPKVAVVITADNHTHAGKAVPKGERLLVDQHTAAHLVAIKVGQIDAAAPTATATATKKDAR